MRGFGRLGISGNWVLDFWGLGLLEYEVGRGFGFQCCILISAIGFWVLQWGRCGETGFGMIVDLELMVVQTKEFGVVSGKGSHVWQGGERD